MADDPDLHPYYTTKTDDYEKKYGEYFTLFTS